MLPKKDVAMLSDEEVRHIRSDWQAIRWRMNVHRVDPSQLARQTRYSEAQIRAGIAGEAVPLRIDFLRSCVTAFHLTDARGSALTGTSELLSYDDCVRLLRPPPAMPPPEGDWWDRPEQP